MASAPSANDLTRQQLDELDALLQRMLTLPHDSVPAAATPIPPVAEVPRPNWRVDSPPVVPVSAPAPHLAVQPQVFEPPPRPVAPPPQPIVPQPVPPPEPAQPIAERKPTPAPKPPAPAPAPQVEAFRFEPITPATATPADVPPPMIVSMVLWPFVAFNWAVDSLLGLFGPPGRLLRSGFGKYSLGFIGIALLIYTGLHVVTERGWVRLPFPLPWPQG